MFGFSKAFAIVLFIAAFFSLGFRSIMPGIYIIAWYAVIRIIWNILTK